MGEQAFNTTDIFTTKHRFIWVRAVIKTNHLWQSLVWPYAPFEGFLKNCLTSFELKAKFIQSKERFFFLWEGCVPSHDWWQIIWVKFKHNVLFKSKSAKKSCIFRAILVLEMLHFILNLQSRSVAQECCWKSGVWVRQRMIWGRFSCCLSLCRENSFLTVFLCASRKRSWHAWHLCLGYSELIPGWAAVFSTLEK